MGLKLYNRNFMKTSGTMSLSYSSCASSYYSGNYFYVKDNILYFQGEGFNGDEQIKYVKNNVIHTFSETYYEKFIIIDEKNAIVQWKEAVHLLNTSDDSIVELWKGECVGYYDGKVYFTDDTTLYVAEIGESRPNIVLSYDELLASDYNGITYKSGENIYQYLLEHPDEVKLLTVGDIPWLESTGDPLYDEYLYTSDYALRIGGNDLDLYIYKTGEMRRIYEIENNKAAIAVVARENELYVSRQYMDSTNWLLRDKEINGTYKYEIQENKWTKIANRTYPVMVQFDEQYLYCYDSYYFNRWVRKIKLK